MTPESGGDFVAALATSILFWLTIAGIAIRRLRIDAQRLEELLKGVVESIDRTRFRWAALARLAVDAVFTTLYGSTWKRMVIVTGIAATTVNVYVLVLLRADWNARSAEIVAIEERTIRAVSPEYADLIATAEGRRRLEGAFRSGNSADDVRIRALYADYWERLTVSDRANAVAYELTLARMFGDSYQNMYWRGQQWGQILAALIFIGLAGIAIDGIAVVGTRSFLTALTAREPRHALVLAPIPFVCFALSIVNYGALYQGNEGFTAEIIGWLLCVGLPLGILGHILTKLVTRTFTKDDIGLVVIVIAIGGGVLGAYADDPNWPFMVRFLLVPASHAREAARLLEQGVTNTVVLLSMVTLFPLIAAAAIAATTAVARVAWLASKEVLVSYILAATVLSGGTYFAAFISIVIASTSVAYVLIKALARTIGGP